MLPSLEPRFGSSEGAENVDFPIPTGEPTKEVNNPIPTREEFLFFSEPEKVLFYVLAYLCLAYMAYQIVGRARLWLKGRPVDWFDTRSGRRYWVPTKEGLAHWISNVWIYILGQKKVRSSRRNSGAPMHLMIFYGFFTFFMATTLLAINTYSPVKFHKGNYYLAYEMVVDIMGVPFLIGVGWAAGRRWMQMKADLGAAMAKDPKQMIQRRRWPISQASSDFWTLGLLFVMGLTGYWLKAARMSANPQPFDWSGPISHLWALAQGRYSPLAYKAVWWFHIAWIYLFFCVLPKMRIRHIVMAVFTAAGKPDRPMGELKSIRMEEVEQTEQIGAKIAADLDRWHLMSLDACMECGRCTEVCPAWNVGKILNPKQVVQDVRSAMETGEELAPAISARRALGLHHLQRLRGGMSRFDPPCRSDRRRPPKPGQRGPTGRDRGATMLRQTASTGNAWGNPPPAARTG